VTEVEVGCTYKFTGEFKTFAGVYADPSCVKFQSRHGHLFGEPEEEYDVVKDEVGKYHYEYTIPRNGIEVFYLTFSGLVEGKSQSPTLAARVKTAY